MRDAAVVCQDSLLPADPPSRPVSFRSATAASPAAAANLVTPAVHLAEEEAAAALDWQDCGMGGAEAEGDEAAATAGMLEDEREKDREGQEEGPRLQIGTWAGGTACCPPGGALLGGGGEADPVRKAAAESIEGGREGACGGGDGGDVEDADGGEAAAREHRRREAAVAQRRKRRDGVEPPATFSESTKRGLAAAVQPAGSASGLLPRKCHLFAPLYT